MFNGGDSEAQMDSADGAGAGGFVSGAGRRRVFSSAKTFVCGQRAGEGRRDCGFGRGLGERPERAAELFKEHAAPRIIVSGFGDCEINRRILLKAGVPANAIQLEDRSRTTRENAGFTIQLLRAENVHRVILVTSWYHSRRALACFEH